MKALRYFFCVVLPPVAILMTGRIVSFLLSLLLTLLGWIPGVIHACLVVTDYQAEQRASLIRPERRLKPPCEAWTAWKRLLA